MRGDDLRGIGAVRESDMVGPATGSLTPAGPPQKRKFGGEGGNKTNRGDRSEKKNIKGLV